MPAQTQEFAAQTPGEAPMNVPAASPESDASGPLADALDNLKRSVQQDDPDGVVRAYGELCRAGQGMKLRELLDRIEGAMGKHGVGAVLDAFAHQSCYMCSGGVRLCESCDGTGEIEEGRACPSCDGHGLAPCQFCRGTGWADTEAVPAELRQAVVLRQAAHARHGLGKLIEALAKLTRQRAMALPLKHRLTLVARILRAQARLAMLSEAEAIDEHERTRMGRAAEKLDGPLETLRAGRRPEERASEEAPDEASEDDEPEEQ